MNAKKYLQPPLKFKAQSLLIGLLLIVLILTYLYKWQNGETSADSLWEFIDPVAGIMTFITSLAIFYVQGYQRWEDSLEKRLSASYYAPNGEKQIEIVRVEKAYLSGIGDIRAWTQSLGSQILGNLDFDLIWDDLPEKTVYENKKWYRDYEVNIYLSKNPLEDPEVVEKKTKPFLKKSFHLSDTEGDLKNLPIVWKRK